MQSGWLTRAGRFRVEAVPCPNPGQRIDLSAPAKGLLHTTEGSTIEGALSVFRVHYAPHFTVGKDVRRKIRVLQHVPLGYMAAALVNEAGGVETNRVVRAQIEVVGFSQKAKWLPDVETTEALAALMRTLNGAADIPLRHAGVARDAQRWKVASGWLGHVDAPENSHWDPGALDWTSLLLKARPASIPPKTKPRPKPPVLDKVRTARLVRRANGVVYTELRCPT